MIKVITDAQYLKNKEEENQTVFCKINGVELDGNKVSHKDLMKIAKVKKFHVQHTPLHHYLPL